MWRKVGVFRSGQDLEGALREIQELQARYASASVPDGSRTFNTQLMQAIELGFLLDTAHMTALGASLRRESRGSHYRRDFPQRDDQGWLRHTMFRSVAGRLEVYYEPVRVTQYQPERRSY